MREVSGSASGQRIPTPDLAGMAKQAAGSFVGKGISRLLQKGGEMLQAILPMQKAGAEATPMDPGMLPGIREMAAALPGAGMEMPALSGIGELAELAMPPSEAGTAMPMAMEPPAPIGGNVEVHFNPQITIQGNADSGTASQIEAILAREREKLLREVERRFPGMMERHEHYGRRVSFA